MCMTESEVAERAGATLYARTSLVVSVLQLEVAFVRQTLWGHKFHLVL